MAAVAEQAPPVSQAPQPPETILRISNNLVLVDVVALNPKAGRSEGGLSKDDFQVFDDGHPVPIKTFDVGAATRPLAFWFIVQCKMAGWEGEGSGFFAGTSASSRPL